MGLRIAHDTAEDVACLYDSVSGWAFGPIFEGSSAGTDALEFIQWLPEDARKYEQEELGKLHAQWRNWADQRRELAGEA